MLLCGHTKEVKEWTENLIPHVNDFGPCEAIGVVENNKLVAGVVFHDYQPNFQSIQLSMAAISPRWAKRQNIAGLLSYPFEQLGCYRVFTATPKDNEKALKVNAHVGFKTEATLHSLFGPNRHGIIMRMLKPDYDKRYGMKTWEKTHQKPPHQ